MAAAISRREWLISAALLTCGCASRTPAGSPPASAERRPTIDTVRGPVPVDRLGVTLTHEHILVDFAGAEQVSPSRYDADRVFETALPHLRQLRALGCTTLVECTPAFLGRDARLLRRLSEASGLHILSNTGYYGAARDKHLPRHAFTESAEQLAARWIREAEEGLDGTDIKPAFMKIGVDEAPLSDVDATLVRAAALTHRRTGLPIASHTTSGAAAMQQLDLLDDAGVSSPAFIWVHAHAERDSAFHARAATRGAWVEFDGIAPATVGRHVDLVRQMKEAGLLRHVLVSHDAGWYHVGEAGGGQYRPYDTLFVTFVPALRAAGFDDADVRQLLVENPRRALSGGA
jgi:predicted metal-dependent phosphotriesterase family hydrolase